MAATQRAQPIPSATLPSFRYAAITLTAVLLIVGAGVYVLGSDLQPVLALAIAVAAGAARGLGHRWSAVRAAMGKGVMRAMRAMFIFILIGMIIGSWIHSGTIATVIYYGLDLVTPSLFLPAGMVLCSVLSLATGTAWGTAGTVGVALMGIGGSLGLPLPLVAGMVLSGTSFGDKMSPVSDTTNLASASAEAGLHTHIRAMAYTTLPTYGICLVLYWVLGRQHGANDLNVDQIIAVKMALATEFQLGWVLLLPPLVVLCLSIARVAAEPTMAAGVATAALVAIWQQGASLSEVLDVLNNGYNAETGLAVVDGLLSRGGIQEMMWTFSLAFIALSLGGILDELGFLQVVVVRFLRGVRSAAGLVTATVGSSVLANMALGDAYLSLILNGRIYQDAFRQRGLQRRMLSRCIEEGGTLTTSIIPWTTSGVFFAGTLGVPVLAYLPFAFLNWINPLLSIVLAHLDIFVLRSGPRPGTQTTVPRKTAPRAAPTAPPAPSPLPHVAPVQPGQSEWEEPTVPVGRALRRPRRSTKTASKRPMMLPEATTAPR